MFICRERGRGVNIKQEPEEDGYQGVKQESEESYQGVYQTGIANPFEPDWTRPPEVKMDIDALQEVDPSK